MAKAAGRDDQNVKDDGRDDQNVKDDGRDDQNVKDDGRGGQGLFGGGGGGCIAVVAFIGPVGLDVGQLASRMLSSGGFSPSRGTALKNVGAAALQASRRQKDTAKKEHVLASAYAEYCKKRRARTRARAGTRRRSFRIWFRCGLAVALAIGGFACSVSASWPLSADSRPCRDRLPDSPRPQCAR